MLEIEENKNANEKNRVSKFKMGKFTNSNSKSQVKPLNDGASIEREEKKNGQKIVQIF